MPPVTFDVYLQLRGKPHPRKVGTTGDMASTYRFEDRTYFFAGADLVARTVTYTDIKPRPAG